MHFQVENNRRYAEGLITLPLLPSIMSSIINTPFSLGALTFEHRLIQGPLAGFSCAPFRELFSHFKRPAYAVSEMISAHDVLYKHDINSRYLYRSPYEGKLCYQISGTDPVMMAEAASKLESLGADLIDINCGCPKQKIRKKGAGSKLLESPDQLFRIIRSIKEKIRCPLTVKIRIQKSLDDIQLAKGIEDAGADGLIVHGRRWVDDYDKPCDFQKIKQINQSITIPVIANGDISDLSSLQKAIIETGCDAFMIGRAGTGKPWLYQTLLNNRNINPEPTQIVSMFKTHLRQLAILESEHQAFLQSKSLIRYYFKHILTSDALQRYYRASDFDEQLDLVTHLVSF